LSAVPSSGVLSWAVPLSAVPLSGVLSWAVPSWAVPLSAVPWSVARLSAARSRRSLSR
jgi:hypothetical protein